MNIPNFQNIKFIDEKGYLTNEWALILQQLFTALQTSLSNEGYQLPQQPTTTITSLQTRFAAAPSPSAYYGDLLYDTTTNQFKVNIAGTFRIVQVV